jgi:F-type H+-transporting ATPase subunit b
MAANNAKQIETLEHIPASEHGKGFPPFAKETFASQILWLVIVFVVLYLIMARVALPRIGGILADRKGRIDGDLAEAERLKEQSDAAFAAYEKILADARGRAQSLASEARARETAAAEAKRHELEATLNRRIAEAEAAIAVRKSAAMGNVRGIAAEAAAAIVERLIGIVPPAQNVDAAVAAVLKN